MSYVCALVLLLAALSFRAHGVCTKLDLKREREQQNALATGDLTLDNFIMDSTWTPTLPINASTIKIDIPQHVLQRGASLLKTRAEVIDCFGLPRGVQSLFSWMFKPNKDERINTRLFLSTRNKRNRTEIFYRNFSDRSHLPFHARKNMVLIIHGFMSNSRMQWVHDMERALLGNMDDNVIAVDWSGGSMSWKYWRAVGNTESVGTSVANFLQKVLKRGLQRQNIHCIGHSLGSHICSFIAKRLGYIGRITGLDPAQPCFNGRGLSEKDATFVDVIHTNAALLKKVGFGMENSIGTVDFFPNGGRNQPGCFLRQSSNFKKWLPDLRRSFEEAICSHGRSYQLFIDALLSQNCKFWGRTWDKTTEGALNALRMPCTPTTCVPMGLRTVNYPARGTFYIRTHHSMPYCIRDMRAEKEMNDRPDATKMIRVIRGVSQSLNPIMKEAEELSKENWQ